MRRKIKPCGFHCIKMKDIGVSFGGQVVLEHVNLHIHCGSLTALIGRNGAGKSTLIKAILGEISHSGTITFGYGKRTYSQNEGRLCASVTESGGKYTHGCL